MQANYITQEPSLYNDPKIVSNPREQSGWEKWRASQPYHHRNGWLRSSRKGAVLLVESRSGSGVAHQSEGRQRRWSSRRRPGVTRRRGGEAGGSALGRTAGGGASSRR